MDRLLDRSLAVLLTIAATALVGRLLTRDISQPWQLGDASEPQPRVLSSTDWADIISIAHRIGSTDIETAEVVVAEFGDFECPYCRRFASELAVWQEFDEAVAVTYVHFPLIEIHRFAMPAARAAECASEQGRFAAMHDVLFAKQDSMGLMPWWSYAKRAHVTDSTAFAKCLNSTSAMPRIAKGLDIGRRLGITGTPSLVINGTLFTGGITSHEAAAVVRSLLTQ